MKPDTHGSKGKGWIGVDLDGTLAKYDGWKGHENIGEPVPAMVKRVKGWISEGKDVRIMTARVAPPTDGKDYPRNREYVIHKWLKQHIGQDLKVTYKKDAEMVELWDDRAVQVKPNTGQRADGVKKAMSFLIMEDKLKKAEEKEMPETEEAEKEKIQEAKEEATDPAEQEAIEEEKKEGGGAPAEEEEEAEKSMGSFSELEEFNKGGGEGSRGGQVVGHTASGKPIYGSKEVKSSEHHTARMDHHRGKLETAAGSGDHEKAYKHAAKYTHHLVQHRKATTDKGKSTSDVKSGVHSEMSATLRGRADRASGKAKEIYQKLHDHHSSRAEDYHPRNPNRKIEKSMEEENKMSGIEELNEFNKGAGSGGMPAGEPRLGGVGSEQGGPLAEKGKTSGTNDSAAGEAINADKPKKDKLSEDDAEVEKQMTTHKKPLEQSVGKSLTPATQREMVAHEHAQVASKLRKGEPMVEVGVGVAAPTSEPEELQKANAWNQGPESWVDYTDSTDIAIEQMQKGQDDFYEHGSPTMDLRGEISKVIECPGCKGNMAKSLAVCPSCGTNVAKVTVGSQQTPTEFMSKSEGKGPVLRPRVEKDVALPDGITLDKE